MITSGLGFSGSRMLTARFVESKVLYPRPNHKHQRYRVHLCKMPAAHYSTREHLPRLFMKQRCKPKLCRKLSKTNQVIGRRIEQGVKGMRKSRESSVCPVSPCGSFAHQQATMGNSVVRLVFSWQDGNILAFSECFPRTTLVCYLSTTIPSSGPHR